MNLSRVSIRSLRKPWLRSSPSKRHQEKRLCFLLTNSTWSKISVKRWRSLNAGAIVIEGNVRALKDAAPIRHLELEVDGDPSTLLSTLEGVRHEDFDGTTRTVILDADSDIRGFIARAEDVGRLRHFSYTTPSLTDLFRDAVE